MIVSESYFSVAILVMQQPFLQMEIKLIQRTYPLLSWVFQKNSLCTVGKVIQFLKTTNNLVIKSEPYFLYPTDKPMGLA